VVPWAAVPTTDAVLDGCERTFRPTGLSTVRGPLFWIGMLFDVVDPPAAVTGTVDVDTVVVGLPAVTFGLVPLHAPAARSTAAAAAARCHPIRVPRTHKR
jgi:hypothetical protein